MGTRALPRDRISDPAAARCSNPHLRSRSRNIHCRAPIRPAADPAWRRLGCDRNSLPALWISLRGNNGPTDPKASEGLYVPRLLIEKGEDSRFQRERKAADPAWRRLGCDRDPRWRFGLVCVATTAPPTRSASEGLYVPPAFDREGGKTSVRGKA